MIKRFNAPTHLDPMPYLSEWHHELEDGSVQIWVQCNDKLDDNAKPHWVRLGDLFEKSLKHRECVAGNPCDCNIVCCWIPAEILIDLAK